MNAKQPVELRTGTLVFTSDGDELGRIKAIEGNCFQIDIPVLIDFWLEKDTVSSTEFGVARLNLPKDAFNERHDADTGYTGINLLHPRVHRGNDESHTGVHQH